MACVKGIIGRGGRTQQTTEWMATAEAGAGRLQRDNKLSTYLEVYLLRGILERHRLLEDIAHLDQLLALCPVVESARDEHFFGGMLPRNEKTPKRQLPSVPWANALSQCS